MFNRKGTLLNTNPCEKKSLYADDFEFYFRLSISVISSTKQHWFVVMAHVDLNCISNQFRGKVYLPWNIWYLHSWSRNSLLLWKPVVHKPHQFEYPHVCYMSNSSHFLWFDVINNHMKLLAMNFFYLPITSFCMQTLNPRHARTQTKSLASVWQVFEGKILRWRQKILKFYHVS